MVCFDQEIYTKAGKLENCCIQGDAVIALKKHRDHPEKADICTERQEHNQKRLFMLTYNLETSRIVKLLEFFLIYTWF